VSLAPLAAELFDFPPPLLFSNFPRESPNSHLIMSSESAAVLKKRSAVEVEQSSAAPAANALKKIKVRVADGLS
jgi:hypothetical protein